MKVLVVVDMQKDFIDGSLGTEEAVKIVPAVEKKIRDFNGMVIATRDTHEENYLDTQEGRKLPVRHCIRNTQGWQIRPEILTALKAKEKNMILDKPSFGSVKLGEYLSDIDKEEKLEDITLVGLCTDICVISNALLLKAYLPEVPIYVDASCCAGVTPQSHDQALEAMKVCQINIDRR